VPYIAGTPYPPPLPPPPRTFTLGLSVTVDDVDANSTAPYDLASSVLRGAQKAIPDDEAHAAAVDVNMKEVAVAIVSLGSSLSSTNGNDRVAIRDAIETAVCKGVSCISSARVILKVKRRGLQAAAGDTLTANVEREYSVVQSGASAQTALATTIDVAVSGVGASGSTTQLTHLQADAVVTVEGEPATSSIDEAFSLDAAARVQEEVDTRMPSTGITIVPVPVVTPPLAPPPPPPSLPPPLPSPPSSVAPLDTASGGGDDDDGTGSGGASVVEKADGNWTMTYLLGVGTAAAAVLCFVVGFAAALRLLSRTRGKKALSSIVPMQPPPQPPPVASPSLPLPSTAHRSVVAPPHHTQQEEGDGGHLDLTAAAQGPARGTQERGSQDGLDGGTTTSRTAGGGLPRGAGRPPLDRQSSAAVAAAEAGTVHDGEMQGEMHGEMYSPAVRRSDEGGVVLMGDQAGGGLATSGGGTSGGGLGGLMTVPMRVGPPHVCRRQPSTVQACHLPPSAPSRQPSRAFCDLSASSSMRLPPACNPERATSKVQGGLPVEVQGEVPVEMGEPSASTEQHPACLIRQPSEQFRGLSRRESEVDVRRVTAGPHSIRSPSRADHLPRMVGGRRISPEGASESMRAESVRAESMRAESVRAESVRESGRESGRVDGKAALRPSDLPDASRVAPTLPERPPPTLPAVGPHPTPSDKPGKRLSVRAPITAVRAARAVMPHGKTMFDDGRFLKSLVAEGRSVGLVPSNTKEGEQLTPRSLTPADVPPQLRKYTTSGIVRDPVEHLLHEGSEGGGGVRLFPPHLDEGLKLLSSSFKLERLSLTDDDRSVSSLQR